MEHIVDLAAMGRRIKEAREKKGFTQEQLAELTELSVQHISVIERGVKAPKLKTFIQLANVLEINADYLLEDSLTVSSKLESNELFERMGVISEREKKRILQVVDVLVDTAEK